MRPVNNAIGRERAGKIIRENPGLSLRQIARVAGISPETARDVRNRIRRGEEPLPQPRTKPRPRRARQPEDTGLPLGGGAAPAAAAAETRTAAERVSEVNRLKADPAMRFSETGRTLLRMLNIHILTGAEWQEIIDNVPPHARKIVAGLARECSGIMRGHRRADRSSRSAAGLRTTDRPARPPIIRKRPGPNGVGDRRETGPQPPHSRPSADRAQLDGVVEPPGACDAEAGKQQGFPADSPGNPGRGSGSAVRRRGRPATELAGSNRLVAVNPPSPSRNSFLYSIGRSGASNRSGQ
ncbi:hypothetical protein SFUMM280S_09638 [Streptomyces fumanus]